MKKIAWCKEQKGGIELVEPNDNLSQAYFKDADLTLQSISKDEEKRNKWDLIMAYYACYNALYAIFMKAGIKCEIHDCSLSLMELVKGFDNADIKFVKDLKDKRIQAQYYLKSEKLENFNLVKQFIFKCKRIVENFDVEYLREKVNGNKK